MYIIHSVGMVYHQHEVLYIIKPQEDFIHAHGVMICHNGIAVVDDIPPYGG